MPTPILLRLGFVDTVDHPCAGQRIAFRHLFEGHALGIHPDPEDALLLAHRCIILRPFERHHHVILADRQEQLVGIGERTEDRQIRAAEIRGDGDFAGRSADLQPFLRPRRLPEGNLRGGWRAEDEERQQEDGLEKPAHQ